MKTKFNFKDKDNITLIEEMARDGLDDMQIAAKIGYTAPYFCDLKKTQSELSEALKRGRKPLNYYVESSLFKRATGLKVKSTTTRQIRDKNTGEIISEEVITTETELPPDTASMAFWLKQRKSGKWNKEPEKIEHSGDMGIIWKEEKTYEK